MGKESNRKSGKVLPFVMFLLLAVLALLAAVAWKIKTAELMPTSPTESSAATSEPTLEPTAAPTTLPVTEPTEEPTTAPTEPYVVSTASVGVTGDIMVHSPVFKAAATGSGKYDFSSMFTYVSEYYQRYDFMIGNLETTLAGSQKPYSGYPRFNCPDSIVDALKDAGMDLLLTANNHTYDTDTAGLIRTQEVLSEKGMAHLGTRLSENIPHYTIQDINGIRIGMICYTYETGDTADGRKTLNCIPVAKEDTNLISSFNANNLDEFYEDVKGALDAMKQEGSDATMIFIHWGAEYQRQANDLQKEIAQNLCELGVDVIVGGHPHVIQPFETLCSSSGHTTYCMYSVGNALSNQRRADMSQAKKGHTEDGMIFGVTFEKWNDGSIKIAEISVLPLWVSKQRQEGKGNVYYIIPLDPEVEDWTRFDISNHSELYKSYSRTMEIVGEGLNSCRAELGLPDMPVY